MTIVTAAFLLFLVIDPLGNIPMFLIALKRVDPKRHTRIILRELLIALAIFLIFLFLGRYLLLFLQVSENSLRIAGGIILFLIALKMIFGGSEEIFKSAEDGEPFLVPLAVPLVAGPSVMTTLILLMAGAPSRWLDWLIAMVIAWGISSGILLSSSLLNRVLGHKGLTALERLMGLLLVTVAVDMFIRGIHQAFP